MSQRYDVIVVGVGTMGSAACCHLARRGVRVLGLEQFGIPNSMGSHHGLSRMIRLAYFEHADYVTLLRRAYDNWADLERLAGVRVLHLTGGLYLGRPDSELVTGSIAAARRHGLAHEVLDRRALAERYPQFEVPGDTIAFFETQAGFLEPEKAVAAFAGVALRHGAELHGQEAVRGWETDGRGVRVSTDRGEYEADKVVLCGGAWTSKVLASCGRDAAIAPPLRVTRQTLGWFWPRRPEWFAYGRLPCWALDLAPRQQFRGLHYGFPMMPDCPGFKVALHWPGVTCDPDTVPRQVLPGDEEELRAAVRRYIPEADGPLLSLRVCLYTNSPDSHFIIDVHPRQPRVVLACGFSGHGFKFASVVGEALADLAMRGRTDLPIGFLGLKRFAG